MWTPGASSIGRKGLPRHCQTTLKTRATPAPGKRKRDSGSVAQPLRHVADHNGNKKTRQKKPRQELVKETVSTNFSQLQQLIHHSLHTLIMDLFLVNADAPKKTLIMMLDLINLNSKAILPQVRDIKALDDQPHKVIQQVTILPHISAESSIIKNKNTKIESLLFPHLDGRFSSLETKIANLVKKFITGAIAPALADLKR